MTTEKIIALLPYTEPFLFVNTIEQIDDNGVTGTFTYSPDAYFYKGHFKNNPITPGVILTETMAQIGLVCLGIFLMKDKLTKVTELPGMAMVSNETDYFLPVFPGEKVTVISRKVYFRFGKLKCEVELKNDQGATVCKGTIAGMLTNKQLIINNKLK